VENGTITPGDATLQAQRENAQGPREPTIPPHLNIIVGDRASHSLNQTQFYTKSTLL